MAKGKSKKSQNHDKDASQKRVKGGERGGMRVVVRVLATDLDGEKAVKTAILKIKGVGHTFAKSVCEVAGISPDKKLGSFTESEIKELEEVIRNPLKFGIPEWVANRRKDVETGENLHVSGSDVDVTEKFDIQRMVDKKTYKGVRHMLGLPVRGQRTRSSFRKGRTVGVVRKAARLTTAGKKKGREKK